MAVHRMTTWQDDDGRLLRVAAAVLDNAWEPLCDFYVDVGPFDSEQERIAYVTSTAREYFRLYGVQEPLFEGSGGP